jgi:hypothetical protein
VRRRIYLVPSHTCLLVPEPVSSCAPIRMRAPHVKPAPTSDQHPHSHVPVCSVGAHTACTRVMQPCRLATLSCILLSPDRAACIGLLPTQPHASPRPSASCPCGELAPLTRPLTSGCACLAPAHALHHVRAPCLHHHDSPPVRPRHQRHLCAFSVLCTGSPHAASRASPLRSASHTQLA